MQPMILRNLFSADMRNDLLADADEMMEQRRYAYDESMGRQISNDPALTKYHEYLLPLAREVFHDESILPSYLAWARYSSVTSRLPAHKDDNACTFTIDYCVRQDRPWGLFVEGIEYLIEEDEALAFLGEDQEHWRADFEFGNTVEMIFFHFVRPDHWFYDDTKPRPKGR